MIGARSPVLHAPHARSPHTRVAVLAVVAALACGGVVSAVMWAGQNHEVLRPEPARLSIRDGSVLVIDTPDPAALQLHVGQEVEFILAPTQGARSTDGAVLAPVANPPCHLLPICAIYGVSFQTFQAHRPGSARVIVSACTSRACNRAGGAQEIVVQAPVQLRPPPR